MIRRLVAFLFLLWAFGFIWFAAVLPGPAADDIETDAIVVPTGSAGRIEHGIEILDEKLAKEMLVTGVDPEVTPAEFAQEFNVSRRQLDCCITLGQAAVDTRSNASETAQWLRARKVERLRLVTADWHMRRASSELRAEIPGDIIIIEDAVPTEPSLKALFLEYNKLLAATLARIWVG